MTRERSAHESREGPSRGGASEAARTSGSARDAPASSAFRALGGGGTGLGNATTTAAANARPTRAPIEALRVMGLP